MKTIIYISGVIFLLGTNLKLFAQTPKTLITTDSTWKYWANKNAPPSGNWKGNGPFDDSAWPGGPSPLGYSPGRVDLEKTTVPTGCGPAVFNCPEKFPAIYFRKTFTIANINDYQKFILQYKRDDGIVIYVNGAEVRREFMPDGVISHATSATAGPATTTDEDAWQPIPANVTLKTLLRTGENVISAEVHQTNTNSPTTNSTDLRFDLWLQGVPPTPAPPKSFSVASGEVWKYWASTSAPLSNNWKGGKTFDDAAWPGGASPLGYSPANEDAATTTVPTGCGTDIYRCNTGKFPAIYFRRTFTIANINDYQKFILQYKRDDGIVIYVNGTEVRREFMPDGVISHATSATAGPASTADEDAWQPIPANVTLKTLLRTGENVISAEVHQTNTNSPTTNSTDLRFDLWLQGVPPAPTPPKSFSVASGEVWKYWASTSAPLSNNWKGGKTFDDAAWPGGASPLGYSPANEDAATTTVPTGCGTDIYRCSTGKFPAIYFRRTFTIANINDYQKFILQYKRDDGIVIYINGAEIRREFMPDGVISHVTSATAGPPTATDENTWQTIDPGVPAHQVAPRMFLHTGENVIAAEVHQTDTGNPTGNSTDLRFDIRLEGVPATAAPQLKIVRGPYLQMGTTSTMTLRWSTEALSKGQIRYAAVATNLTVGNPQSMTAAEPASVSGVTDHQVTLTQLLPNQKYYYVVEAAGATVVQLEGSATAASLHYFYTAPTPGTAKKTRIWALGDFGSLGTRQTNVINSFKTFKQQKRIDYIDLWLWMGDNAYDWGLDEDYTGKVFDKKTAGAEGRYDWMFRQTPFYATPGNHEYQSGQVHGGLRYEPHPIHYYDVVNNFTKTADGGGGEPSGREEYYSFNYNNIHIVSLDSYGFESERQVTTIFADNGPQAMWLKRDLLKAQADPNIHWIIAYWHHPPYTMGTYNSDDTPELTTIRNFLDTLEKYKVDMVINGHSHVYERSGLMRNHYGPSTTFNKDLNNAFLNGNAQSSGKFDGSPNSCFYFKNSTSATNEGLIYVVNGSGGRGGGVQTGKWPHPAMQTALDEGGSMYLEVDGKRLDAKFINESGVVKDQFTVFKDADGFAIPPTDGKIRTAACECTDAKGFTHYVDSVGTLLLSIKKHGYSIGKVGVAPFDLKLKGKAGVTHINAYSPTNYVRLASYGYRNVTPPWIIFNRHWTLTPGAELGGNNQVIIRQYYKEADLTALNVPYTDDPMGHGNLKPFKINDNGATAYNLDPTAGHANIPQAGAYNRPGAWIYNYRGDGTNGAYPTPYYWMLGRMGNGNYYGDYMVGRLKGGGGFGAPSNFMSNPSGQQDRASQMWYYLVSKTAPSSGWNSTPFYDLTGWGRGYLPLGYSPQGEDGELTQIPNGCPSPNDVNTDCDSKTITTYFKGYLNYNVPSLKSYILNYRRNDGVIIYVDGQEVLPRDPNMPPGLITPTTLSKVNTNELEWRTVILPASAVNGGTIAAEVHQSSPGSPDLHFNLELVASPDVAMIPIGLRAAAPVQEDDPSLIVLYPNPVEKGKVFFSPELNYQTLRLTDVQGKTYRYISQPGVIQELDVSSLPAGVYVLTSQGTDAVTRYKIVKL